MLYTVSDSREAFSYFTKYDMRNNFFCARLLMSKNLACSCMWLAYFLQVKVTLQRKQFSTPNTSLLTCMDFSGSAWWKRLTAKIYILCHWHVLQLKHGLQLLKYCLKSPKLFAVLIRPFKFYIIRKVYFNIIIYLNLVASLPLSIYYKQSAQIQALKKLLLKEEKKG